MSLYIKMIVKISLIFLISLNSIHKSREEEQNQTSQPNDVISTLSRKYESFENSIDELVDKRLDPLTRLRLFVQQSFKAYTIIEPTAKETDLADKAMSISFGLSSGFLPDNNMTMNTFCEESKDRREMARNYVDRKYTFNLICRLAFNLMQKELSKQNDYYCDSNGAKEEFIRNAQKIKDYETDLTNARNNFKMSLINIQNTNLGYTKTKAFCCSYWKFRNETLEAVKDEATRHFFRDMLENYFRMMTQYFCFYQSVFACNMYVRPEKVQDNEYSLAMNMVRATAKVTSIVL